MNESMTARKARCTPLLGTGPSIAMTASSRSWALLLVLVVAGCLGRSPQVHHFMLATSASNATRAQASEMAVMVGPVRLPAYLERPQMARLGSDGEVELDEVNRWLGGFEENFLRALSLGLASELGSERIVIHPSKAPFAIDSAVRLHIDDMILDSHEGLRVRVRWATTVPAGASPARLFVMDEVFAVRGGDAGDLVRAHDEALAELVRRIAAELGAVASI